MKNLHFFSPVDDGAWCHQGLEVDRLKALARQFGDGHHSVHHFPPGGIGISRHARLNNSDFFITWQVVERDYDVLPVDLGMVQALGAVIRPVQVALADRVGGANRRQ